MSEQVTMSAAERAEWEAFKAEKAKKEEMIALSRLATLGKNFKI